MVVKHLESAEAPDDKAEVGGDADRVVLCQLLHLLSDGVDGDSLSPAPLAELLHHLSHSESIASRGCTVVITFVLHELAIGRPFFVPPKRQRHFYTGLL